jgi:mannose-6-phosphate isomerase-like protein (cupin superfamily)
MMRRLAKPRDTHGPDYRRDKADGLSRAVVKGNIILIPANTPHQIVPTGGAPIAS